MNLQRFQRPGPLLLGLMTAGLGLSACAGGAPVAAVQWLQCQAPGGASVGVIHQQGQPKALTLGVVAGARECSTRSTLAPRPDAGGWRFDWDDAAVGVHYTARLTPLAHGGFQLRLMEPAAAAAAAAGSASPPSAAAATVACGALALPQEFTLKPGDAACQTTEDRSEALQDTWHSLRDALLQRDPERLRAVLAAAVMLNEGSSDDSPSVPAEQVVAHLACMANLSRSGQTWVVWAQARPHILTAPTGLDRTSDDAVSLGGFGGLQWQDGRWRLTWLAASRSVLLRDCAWPLPVR